MTPIEFLRQRNIVTKNKSDLIIGFDNDTKESLIELLESYHKSKLNIVRVSGSYCMYCGKELKPNEAIVLCKKCTE